MKAKPTTKEQLVYYLIRNISLGTYDKRFLSNLENLFLQHKPVTSNQADLLNKIILRYMKQLRKKEIDANEMVNLEWTVDPIESTSEFTDAFITIKNDTVELKTPYKKDFISEIRTKELDIVWHKETKHWTAPLCESVLKHFIKCVEKHYHMIHYCSATKAIINTLADYESATCWDPTLVKINGNLYIAGITSPLYEVIKDIPLTVEPDILARLVCYGVTISNDVIVEAIEKLGDTPEAHKLIDFAVSQSIIFDCSDAITLVDFLKKIKCDFVIIIETFGVATKELPSLVSEIKKQELSYHYIDRKSNANTIDIDKYEFPVTINSSLWASPNQDRVRQISCKTVHLGNNKPIDIL